MNDLKHSADWEQLREGTRKFVHSWLPDHPPRGIVCIIHGLGEHGGRYDPLARHLAASGLAVFAFDQQGHGRSDEPRGCIHSYESLLQDIELFQQWARHQYPALPAVLFGHSMGGNLTLNYALRPLLQPTAVISSSPMIMSRRQPGWLFEQLARFYMWLHPNYRLKSEVIVERLMSHPEEQQALREDELFHSQLSLRLGAALIDTGRWALRHAHRLATPTLLTHGTEDYLTSLEASQDFARRAGPACRMEVLHGHMHDPFRDLNRERAIGLFLEFIHETGQGGK